MLEPPISMFGIPAMRKLAKEIITWEDKACFHHMVAFAGLTPPLIAEDLSHNDGLRFELARVLKVLGQKYQKREWCDTSNMFIKSGELIIELCRKAMTYDSSACSELLDTISGIEEESYRYLSHK